jgi:hypothetical protein
LRTARNYLFGFSLLILVFPAALPPVLTVLSGGAFSVACWFWLAIKAKETR